jgi:hypothetical protein
MPGEPVDVEIVEVHQTSVPTKFSRHLMQAYFN